MKRKALLSLGTLIFLLAVIGQVPLLAAQQSFAFASGNASSSINGGAGPTTTGIGSIGSLDPVTTFDSGSPAIIISKNPAWQIIPDTQWISSGNTTFSGPPNGAVVSFAIKFFLPSGAINPNLTVSVLGDDGPSGVFLNKMTIAFHQLILYNLFLELINTIFNRRVLRI